MDALAVSLDNMACGFIMKALGNGTIRKGTCKELSRTVGIIVESTTGCLKTAEASK